MAHQTISREEHFLHASTIDEILGENFINGPPQKKGAHIAAKRLGAWCSSAASGDWNQFFHRLKRDGLEIKDVLNRFANPVPANNHKYPEWVFDSQRILEVLRTPENTENFPGGFAEDPSIPFWGVVCPLVADALREVQDRGTLLNSHFAKSAINDLAMSLAIRLSDLLAPLLYSCYGEYKESPQGVVVKNEGVGGLYAEFVKFFRREEADRIYRKYPVALRLTASIWRQWIESTIEFVSRANADWFSLCEITNFNPLVDMVVGVKDDAGDTHNFGRSVKIISLSNGGRIVYKPKDCTLDFLWMRLIDTLNDLSPPIDLQAARILPLNSYGWSEFVIHSRVETRSGAEQYYTRAGALLSLLHILCAQDMHEENIIACGEFPVVIDMEMLLQPLELGDGNITLEREAFEAACKKVADSVVATMFLPTQSKYGDQMVAHGGLHHNSDETGKVIWSNINRDDMFPSREMVKSDHHNSPEGESGIAKLTDYVDYVLRGYRDYSRYLGELEIDILEPFSSTNARRLLKNTMFYSGLIHRLKDFRNMSDGIIWSVDLDFVSRFMNWEKETDDWWPLARGERLALAELNVPFFATPVTNTTIFDYFGNTTNSNQAVAAMDRAGAKMECISDNEITWQCYIAKMISGAARSDPYRNPLELVSELQECEGDVDTSNELIECRLHEIARHLDVMAIKKQNSAAWIGLEWMQDSTAFRLSPLGSDLYAGYTGICLFLAAYSSVFSDRKYGDLAIKGLSGLRSDMKGANSIRMSRGLGCGVFQGLGSIIYTLTNVGILLNDQSLIDDANTISGLYTEELIQLDNTYDFTSGSAGAIMALVNLYQTTSNVRLIETAVLLADHILGCCGALVESPGLVSRIEARKPFNGLSHGCSGFALAFSSLGLVTGNRTYFDISRRFVEHENLTYDSVHKNWPDSRPRDMNISEFWPCQWCHGAAGIGLARVHLLDHLSQIDSGNHSDYEQILMNDVQNSVACIIDSYPYPYETVCCGTLGSIETLNSASSLLRSKDPRKASELSQVARERLCRFLSKRGTTLEYFNQPGDRNTNLGIFRGESGIGYTMLRILESKLPNVIAASK